MKLPASWAAATLQDVARIEMGQSPAGSATNVDGNGLPLIGGASDYSGNTINAKRFSREPTKVCEAGDIVLCVRATIGRTAIADQRYILGRGVAGIRPEVDRPWLRYLLDAEAERLDAAGTGTTFRQIDKARLAEWPVPLPPLPEQRRIVAKLDRLSARSKAARDHLARATHLAARAKQALLAAAFAGDHVDEWQKVRLEDVIADALIGLVRSKAEQKDAGTPYIRMNHYDLDGEWNFRDLTCVTITSSELHRYELKPRDILFNTRNSRELVGKVALWPEDRPGHVYNNNLLRIRMKTNIDPWFAYYYMIALPFRTHLETVKSATTSVAAIYQRSLFAAPFSFPSLSEQREIVRCIEAAFARIDRFAGEAARAARLLDRLDERLLARAFRGELVPQDPADEPASALLARLREARAGAPKTRRGRKPRPS